MFGEFPLPADAYFIEAVSLIIILLYYTENILFCYMYLSGYRIHAKLNNYVLVNCKLNLVHRPVLHNVWGWQTLNALHLLMYSKTFANHVLRTSAN